MKKLSGTWMRQLSPNLHSPLQAGGELQPEGALQVCLLSWRNCHKHGHSLARDALHGAQQRTLQVSDSCLPITPHPLIFVCRPVPTAPTAFSPIHATSTGDVTDGSQAPLAPRITAPAGLGQASGIWTLAAGDDEAAAAADEAMEEFVGGDAAEESADEVSEQSTLHHVMVVQIYYAGNILMCQLKWMMLACRRCMSVLARGTTLVQPSVCCNRGAGHCCPVLAQQRACCAWEPCCHTNIEFCVGLLQEWV